MIKCPNCGTDNRDTSRFCRVCGKALPLTQPTLGQPPLPSRAPSGHTLSPLPPIQSSIVPVPVPPTPLTRARPLTARLATTVNPSATLSGTILDDPVERRDVPPRDVTKWMVGLAIAIVVVPPLLIALLTISVIACVLAALGAGALITCLMLPLGMGLSLFGLFRRPQRTEVPYLEFRVQEPSGNVVNIEMVGQRRGGRLSRGDEVEIEGEWLNTSQISLRAWRVEVRHAVLVGGPVRAYAIVTAEKPWDRKWGSIALVVAVILALVLYVLPLVTIGIGAGGRGP